MMAEETDQISINTKIDRSDEHNSKDKPAEKPQRRVVKKRSDAVPHYLRASTGSCHDACKYGKPHEFKEKPWKPMRRRISAPLRDSKKTVDIQIFVDKKVKGVIKTKKLEPIPAAESPPVDARSSMEKNTPSSRKSPSHDSFKKLKHEARPFKKSPSPELPKVLKKVAQPPAKTIKRQNASATIKDVPSKRASSNAKEIHPPASIREVPSKHSSSNAKERNPSAGSLKPSRATVKPSSSPDNTKTKTVDNPRTSRVSMKKVLTPPAVALSLKRTSKLEVRSSSWVKDVISNVKKTESTPKDQSMRSQASSSTKKIEPQEPVEQNMEEKMLHMIDTKEYYPPVAQNGSHFIQPPTPLSPESLNSSSQTNSLSFTSREVDDQDELGSEYSDSESDDSVSQGQTGQTRNAGSLGYEDRDPASLKLKFRRAKVVEPQSETEKPRKLRFRQGTILEANQGTNAGAGRKSYRRRVTEINKKESETSAVKVVLKHQDVEAKKDEQILLNNVIEQTASKLVETRKSKVKALVGAFETVISLQERKPSADR